VGKRLTFLAGRTRRATGMHKGKDSPERRQTIALVETSREDLARLKIEAGGWTIRRSTALKSVISTGRLGDEEMHERILEAVA